MESAIAIILMLMLAINIPLATVLYRGIPITTESECPADIKAVKKNHTLLKVMSTLNVVFIVALLVMTSME